MVSKELSKFIEPMVILTLLISVTYYLGWIYILFYFTRLGIQYQSLNLSAPYYLMNAFYIISLTIVFSLFLLLYHYISEFNIKHYIHDTQTTILIILLIISLLSISNAFYGHMHAKYLIEGERDAISVNFSWKEDSPKEMEGKELMLIIYSDHKYYVVAKQKPAPKYPEIYIIPDDQIKFVLMKKNLDSLSFITNLTP